MNTRQTMVQLWNEGKTGAEIAASLSLSVRCIFNALAIARRQWGVESVPLRIRKPRVKGPRVPRGNAGRKPKHTTAYWEPIAALWREGKTSTEIATILKVPAEISAPSMVQDARRHLGVEAVPFKPHKVLLPPHAPITMTELGRHYLRRVGEEFIFRTEDGVEEVWTKTLDPSGMVWKGRGRGPVSVKLAFKNVMGLMEKRAV